MPDLPAIIRGSIKPLDPVDPERAGLPPSAPRFPTAALAEASDRPAAPIDDYLAEFVGQEQKKRKWCWAAVCAMLSEYYCDRLPPDPNCPRLTQCEVATRHPESGGVDCCDDANSPRCDSERSLQLGLAAIGLPHDYAPGGAPFSRFVSEIRAGRPIPVRVKRTVRDANRASDIYHFVIIIGCDDLNSRLLVWDPVGAQDNVRVDDWQARFGDWVGTYFRATQPG